MKKVVKRITKKKIVRKSRIVRKASAKRVQKKTKKASYRTNRAKRSAKKTKEGRPSLAFAKSVQNPIISPKAENGWEAWQTFNPGAVLLNDKVHFIYRAIGEDGLSRLGYAVSSDGFRIDERSPYPVYEHRLNRYPFNFMSFASGGSWGGAEDPRIVRVLGEDILYMTYTACDEGLGVALTSIKVKDFLKKKWNWEPAVLISKPGEVHKNWVIFPEKISGKYAILHSINPEVSITYVDDLKFDDGNYVSSFHGGKVRKNCWDSWVRGAGPPPIKTKEGWLLFYHAIDKRDQGRYKVGAMILDLNDPTKVLHRSIEPILEPDEEYENNGFKAGIVYASGAVVKDGKIFVYYGCSDSYIGVAYADFEEFMEALKKEMKPKLRLKTLKVR
ncbi:MAG: glycosidase [Candidatus Colwellbacteria bacterium]|nr:glycosidase [Candidatus Colwellbacteria bacterium]